ncbi:MAG TPA: hypothetical protein VID25_03650 [Candidatus Limnocylindrales bacterium]|jgi:hypothetical protein
MDRGSGTLTNVARIALGILAALATLGAVVAFAEGIAIVGLEALVGAAVLGLGAAYEHGRYRASVKGSEAGRFQRTDEVFTDPTTGQLTRVWYDQASGRRDYRPDA